MVQVSRCRGEICCGRIVEGKSVVCHASSDSLAVVGASNDTSMVECCLSTKPAIINEPATIIQVDSGNQVEVIIQIAACE